MEKRIYPIWHKGKKIYFTDWSNLKKEEETLKAIEETVSYIEKMSEYDLYEIIDATGSFSPPKVMTALKDAGKRTKKFNKRKAIVGITGSKRIILSAVNRFMDGNIKGFDTIDEAKEWIVKG